jgi:hypothetical protein
MATHGSGNPISFIRRKYLKNAFESTRKVLALSLLLLMVINGGWAREIDSSVLLAAAAGKAQNATAALPQAAAAQSSAPQPQTQPANAVYMIPAGTKLPLGLLRPLRVKPGQDVYLQITFPVTVGSQMLIPPGAYVQGIVEKVIKKDRRSLQFTIVSGNLIFSTGYTVPFFRHGSSRNIQRRANAAAARLQQWSARTCDGSSRKCDASTIAAFAIF